MCRVGGQSGCERRLKVLVKNKKMEGWRSGRRSWGGGGVSVDVNEELKFFEKSQKKSGVVGRGVRWGSDWWGGGGGGQVKYEQRSEAFVTFKTNIFFSGWGGSSPGGGGGGGGGRQGRCERKSEVFVKIKKKKMEGGVGPRGDGGSG